MKRETEYRMMRDPLLHYAMNRGAACGMTEEETFEFLVNLLLEKREEWLKAKEREIMESLAQPLVIPSNPAREPREAE